VVKGLDVVSDDRVILLARHPGGLMKTEKRKKLEAADWKVGDAREFLALTPDESDFVEIKLALARRLRTLRSLVST
jgi:hypothetical protein